MEQSEEVYVGVWRNWDKDKWYGETITLPTRYAAYLVAFIAIFVRLVGAQLWGVICFVAHQYLSSRAPRDGLHYQRQALLRNTSGEVQTLWKLVQLHWRWRKKLDGILKRFLIAAGPTAISVLALGAAGVLSSQLLNVGDEVLIRSSGNVCGWLADGIFTTANTIYPNETENRASDSLYVAARWSIDKALEYKTACYEPKTAEGMISPLCGRYARPLLAPKSVNYAAPCLFPGGNCDGGGVATEIDSGYVDSSADLGVNTPVGDRVQFRRVTTCSVLNPGKYESKWIPPRFGLNLAPGFADRYLWKYYDIFKDPANTASAGISNETMLWQPADYYLGTWSRYQGNSREAKSFSGYDMIDELIPKNGDIVVLSLLNMLVYANPVTDPWFRASSQNDTRGLYMTVGNIPNAWYPDRVSSYLACSENYQFCAGGSCTPLAGIYEHRPPPSIWNSTDSQEPSAAYTELGLNANQAAVYSVVWKAAWSMRIFFASLFLGNRILLAERFRHDTVVSAPVNSNQWALEVENLHNLSMSALQRRVVEYASPPDVLIRPGVGTRQFIVPPANTDLVQLCHNIKMRSPGHSSFSLPSLLAILICGCLIVLTNSCLPSFVFWLRRRRNPPTEGDKTSAWRDDQLFHLQRAALESQHVGPWEAASGDIPLIKDYGKIFTVPDVRAAEIETEKTG